MRIIFIRHAHSVSQEYKDIVVGRSPEYPLTQEGKQQAKELSFFLNKINISHIYSSTCIRALETAEIVSRYINIPVMNCESLIERSQGDFEKKKKNDVYSDDVVRLIHLNQVKWAPPNGESLEDVANRVSIFIQDINSRSKNGVFLMVTHLMVLWAVFYLCTKCHHSILPHLKMDNCSLTEIDFNAPDQFRLISWNRSLIEQHTH